jgi:hypothetical protein
MTVLEKNAPSRDQQFSGRISGIDKIKTVDWNGFNFIDLFAGIGGIRLGFEHVGGIFSELLFLFQSAGTL